MSSTQKKTPKVVLISGANRGLGLEMVSQLLANTDATVLLGTRKVENGEKALQSLKSEESKRTEVVQFDVSDEKSISNLVAHVKEKYGGLDVLINNAGVMPPNDFGGDKAVTVDDAQFCLQINFHAVRNVCHAFRPIMRSPGRIVNVSSMLSSSALGACSEKKQAELLDKDLTEDQLVNIMNGFLASYEKGTAWDEGWGKSYAAHVYSVTKVGCSQLTRILARDEKDENVSIVAGCPGWCQTDMGTTQAPRSAKQGAADLLKLALGDEPKSGEFWCSGVNKNWLGAEVKTQD